MLCFHFCQRKSVRTHILSLYYIVFGLLSICMELQFKFIGKYCKNLLAHSWRGMWYLFLATLSFGIEWWAVLVGIGLIGNGMLNSFVGCSPVMHKEEGAAEERKPLTDEEVELKVELGKLDGMDDMEDMDDMEASKDYGYQSTRDDDEMDANV